MNRALILIKVLIISIFLFSCTSGQHEQVPNIILIMADDLGWGDTGFNGNDIIHTPSLDELAYQGIIFRRFYSAAPVCSPTRASCLTGRHPYRMGIHGANTGHIKRPELTLAELLKSKGYTTGHFGKWHLGTLTNTVLDANRGGRGDTSIYSPPWENGFDVCFSTESKVPTWDPMITPGPEAGDIGNRIPGSDFGTYYWTGEGEIVTDNLKGDDSRIIMDRVLPFIEGAINKNDPFFAVISYHTPHLPVLAGPEYRSLYNDHQPDIQHYYGSISAMDQQVGRLVGLLKENKQYNNT
ncbi:MAG TPA: N-acetylgalactosamine 6-sulfate sulfatase, partial [Bacteroidales bacterium]|nr:N-acetylgalactosamine 6-sulfate sulfatase [Bacteroidales bacterium]